MKKFRDKKSQILVWFIVILSVVSSTQTIEAQSSYMMTDSTIIMMTIDTANSYNVSDFENLMGVFDYSYEDDLDYGYEVLLGAKKRIEITEVTTTTSLETDSVYDASGWEMVGEASDWYEPGYSGSFSSTDETWTSYGDKAIQYQSSANIKGTPLLRMYPDIYTSSYDDYHLFLVCIPTPISTYISGLNVINELTTTSNSISASYGSDTVTYVWSSDGLLSSITVTSSTGVKWKASVQIDRTMMVVITVVIIVVVAIVGIVATVTIKKKSAVKKIQKITKSFDGTVNKLKIAMDGAFEALKLKNFSNATNLFERANESFKKVTNDAEELKNSPHSRRKTGMDKLIFDLKTQMRISILCHKSMKLINMKKPKEALKEINQALNTARDFGMIDKGKIITSSLLN